MKFSVLSNWGIMFDIKLEIRNRNTQGVGEPGSPPCHFKSKPFKQATEPEAKHLLKSVKFSFFRTKVCSGILIHKRFCEFNKCCENIKNQLLGRRKGRASECLLDCVCVCVCACGIFCSFSGATLRDCEDCVKKKKAS